MTTRRATHSGSWYSDSARELHKQFDNWFSHVKVNHGPARAIIAPHAGYQYCGSCAAYAYKQINPALVKRVFILGPSHHFRLSGCALSSAVKYQTPFYNLTIDKDIYDELYATRSFETMNMSTDEDEHSIEMHLPYIAKVMEQYKDNFTIVPVLIGSLSNEKETHYGRIFSRYLSDPSNLFVISSDFCHWGTRFRYQYYDKSFGIVHQSIQHLDKMGMDIIEKLIPDGFSDYLKKYGNTICGRHPIAVLLNAVSCLHSRSENRISMKFLKYAQSSQCYNMGDSSVSYAASSLVIE
ncbi:Protein MEMO1 [Nymphon striatum]|nr:Protein MEMO1 [Nymphon striatum]KAG1709743.1 Protein MEMO1 [Nymphon striatum]